MLTPVAAEPAFAAFDAKGNADGFVCLKIFDNLKPRAEGVFADNRAPL